MKHSRSLWLISTGTLLFAIGLFTPLNLEIIRGALLIAGAALVLLFYLYTLIEVINSRSLRQGRKIFWLIAVICVPILGNLIYLVMNGSMNKRQTPRLQNF